MTLENLLAWCVQILVLGFAGTLLPALLRLRDPGRQLRYYQALLAFCVLLPVVQPWRTEIVRDPLPPRVSSSAPVVELTSGPSAPGFPLEQGVWIALAAGAALRALWLAAGMLRLRKYRMDSHPLYPLPHAVESARERTRTDALVCLAREQTGAVTFGLRVPVVLLPPRFLHLPHEAQFAVACHEFLHVRRRDWLQHMIEEAVAIVFWFHPAVWWLVSRIRLAREQAVDAQVLQLTQARDPYVDALITMAGAKPSLDLAPAPLFLRQRHLKERIFSIVKGVSMSRSRLVSSYLSMGAALAGATWMSVIWFPLRGLPQVQTEPSRVQMVPRGAVLSDAPGVTVKPGGGLLHRQGVQYPRDAARAGIGGTVLVDAVLDQQGNVTDARVLSGPDQLRRAALESVLQWHFTPETGRIGRAQVTIEFAPPPVGGLSSGSLRPPPPPPPPPPGVTAPTVMLNRVDLSALPESLQNELRPRVQRFEGRQYNYPAMNEVRDAVLEVEPHMSFAFQGDTLRLILGPASQLDAPPVPAPEFRRLRTARCASASAATCRPPSFASRKGRSIRRWRGRRESKA